MKYTIIHVNDRAKDAMNYNKNILKNFEYIDTINFFNGNLGNAWDVINHKGIRQDVWNPYDGRTLPPFPGELGIWVSTLNVWQYIVNNKIDQMLVLEDDITLQDNFIENFYTAIKDLPIDFDFLSLYYFNDQNKIDLNLSVNSNKIQKSHNQYSAGQAIIYSYAGAKKLLNCVLRKGIEYTTDCFIFRQSLEGLVEGYSITEKNDTFLTITIFIIKNKKWVNINI
jgi:GR25 family glycosyltransferase involved in LPS biosynthesis